MGTPTLAVTYVCSLWRGWRPIYTPEHVYRLRDLLQEYGGPHDFVCLTDQKVPDVKTCPLPDIPWKRQHKSIPNCYGRMWLFSNEAMYLGETLVSIDLDVTIQADISGLFTAEDFKILEGTVCPYNGSLFQIRPGINSHMWSTLTGETAKRANKQRMPNGSRYYGSDQAWMSYMLPDAPTWGQKDGIYQHVSGKVPSDARMIFYAGRRKPWDLKA